MDTIDLDSRSPTLMGVSCARDPRAAVEELHAAIWRDDLTAVLFFCSPKYDLPALARELNQRFPGVHVVGCTTAGEITPLGYIDGSITALGFAAPDFATGSVLFRDLGDFSIAACKERVQAAIAGLDAKAPHLRSDATFGFLMVDGMSKQEEQVVSTMFNALYEIPLLGGSAGDDLTFERTCVFADGEFHERGAILLLVRTHHPFRIIKTEHFESTGERMVVTRADSDRRRVMELNAEPAAHEYARVIGLHTEQLTPLVFAAHPLVVKVGGEYHVRSIQQANDDGSLNFFCAIDEGIVLTVAKSGDILQDLRTFFEEVHAEIGDLQTVIGCDCILRRLEIERKRLKPAISEILLANKVIGFSTYGEQYHSMHVNQTFTGVAIGYARSP